MIRILIFDLKKSDITSMSVRGWHVVMEKEEVRATIYRDFKPYNTRVRFVLEPAIDGGVVLKRYHDIFNDKGDIVETIRKEVKHYATDGVKNCEGTLFINDHSIPDRIYGFWRNRELQSLMDSKGIEKLSFRKEESDTFDMTIENNSDVLEFETDGFVTKNDDNTCGVFGATYVYRITTNELILSQKYDIEKLTEKLLA
jgi:hypothetical protein